MRLKIFRAESVSQAMAQVRKDLGPDALILSTRRTQTGIELTAALEQVEHEPLPMTRQAPPENATLAWHGIPAPLAQRLASGPLAHSLASILRFGTLPVGGTAPPILFTGPPGAGKTLTTARLATRLVLAGITPLVITADGRRAGAAEELAAYTRLLGVSLVVASHPATLARALQHRPPGSPVLIDTTGINPFDHAATEASQALAASAGATQVLVLPAGQDPLEAAEQAAAFAAAGARHLIPTRLDIARRLGSVVTAAVAGGLILSEAGTGPGATDGLTALSAEALARRLSRQPDQKHAAEKHAPGLAAQAHASPIHA
jgi:flagellar biosynthesis protein FlhF